MRSQLTENGFLALLRQCYSSSRCQASARSRPLRTALRAQPLSRSQHYHQGPNNAATNQFTAQGSESNTTILQAKHKDAHRVVTEPRDFAVLGGGITGLATAYYLTQEKPHAKITLYEGSERLGGWLHSTAVDVGNGSVVFEQGPRTLRPSLPSGLVTLNMARAFYRWVLSHANGFYRSRNWASKIN